MHIYTIDVLQSINTVNVVYISLNILNTYVKLINQYDK